MPKIILRCNYLKNAPPSHLANYMNYISTREGVEKVDSTSALLYWCRILFFSIIKSRLERSRSLNSTLVLEPSLWIIILEAISSK